MLGTELSRNSKRQELFEALFQLIDQEFGGSAESLEEQAELFFKETSPMALISSFRGQDRAEGMLKNLSSRLRSYILVILEEDEKKAKQYLQAWEKGGKEELQGNE